MNSRISTFRFLMMATHDSPSNSHYHDKAAHVHTVCDRCGVSVESSFGLVPVAGLDVGHTLYGQNVLEMYELALVSQNIRCLRQYNTVPPARFEYRETNGQRQLSIILISFMLSS